MDKLDALFFLPKLNIPVFAHYSTHPVYEQKLVREIAEWAQSTGNKALSENIDFYVISHKPSHYRNILERDIRNNSKNIIFHLLEKDKIVRQSVKVETLRGKTPIIYVAKCNLRHNPKQPKFQRIS